MKNFFIILLICIICILPEKGFCEWQGPIEIISGSWGSNTGEFGFRQGRPGGEDGFPKCFGINDKGYILVIVLTM